MEENAIIYLRCRKCGRLLKTDESKKLGFGPVCYLRYMKDKCVKKKSLIRYLCNHDTATTKSGKQ